MDRLNLVARITPKPECLDLAREALLEIIDRTLAEPGCHIFRLHDGTGEGEGSLFLYEEFDDEAALQAHYDEAYTKAVFEKYQTWLAKPVEVIKLRRIA